MLSKLEIYCEAIMEAAWLAAVVVIPLFFNVSSNQTFEPDKAFVLAFLAIIAGVACVLKRFAGEKQQTPGKPSDMPLRTKLGHPIAFWVLILAAIYTLSAIFSIAPVPSWLGLYTRAQGMVTFYSYVVLFWVALSELRNPLQLKRLQYAFILTSLPIAGYGILQYFGADFLPWSNPMGDRSSGSMGNPIFLGAYLVMAAPLTFGGLVDAVRMMRIPSGRLSGQIRAACCGLALALQAFALLFTQSRGPVIGLAVAAYVCLFLVLIAKRTPGEGRRMHPLMAAGAGIIAPMFFAAVVVNASRFGAKMAAAGFVVALAALAAGYWTAWRSTWGRRWLWLTWFVQAAVVIAVFSMAPGSTVANRLAGSPLARLTQLSGNSVDVRRSLWQTGIAALQSGSPSEAADRFRYLRPIIGYGPENTGLIANFYATPELVRLHTRESVDRMHNETFESLIGAGCAGAGTWVILLAAVFCQALRLLGFSFGRGIKNPFIPFCAAGILAGVGLPLLFGRAYLLAIGIPGGLLAGMIAFVVWSGFRNPKIDFEGNDRQIFVLCILGGITAHFVETAVGIAVTSTRTYFFLLLAILTALSLRDWRAIEEPARKRTAKAGLRPSSVSGVFALVACYAGLVLGWAFMINRLNENSALDLFRQTWFSGYSGQPSALPVPGSFLLLLLTVIGSVCLIWGGSSGKPEPDGSFLKPALKAAGLILSVWLAVSFVSALFWTAAESPLRRAGDAEARIAIFLGVLFLLMLAVAWRLTLFDSVRLANLAPVRARSMCIAALAALLALGAIHVLVSRPMRADTVHRVARISEDSADLQTAIQLYARASSLAPHVISYWTSKGLAQASAAGSSSMWEESIQSLLHALSLNPLDVGSNRTLASVYMNQAERSGEPNFRNGQLQKAIESYERAVRLAPNHPDAYCGLGRCYFLLGDSQKAAGFYKKSLKLNPNHARTHMFLGEMHYRLNQLELAREDFRKAATLDTRYVDAWKNLGFVLGLLGQKEEAIRVNLRILPRIPNDSVLLCRIAALYFSVGESSSGHTYARRAYAASPVSQRETYEQFVADLQNPQ